MEASNAFAAPGAGYLLLDDVGGFLTLVHEPTGETAPTGIVIVPPFGWEEVASYRARRVWAERLCSVGHVVLRFDLPATGDSSGADDDAHVVAQWIDAVDAAARDVGRRPGVRRVAVIALGLGGLLGVAAAERGGFEDLVIWGAPASGRAAVRQQRALSRLQTHRALEEEALPEGSLEASGFILSAETLAGLAAMEGAAGSTGSLERVLVLGRSGSTQDPGPAQALRASGVPVDLADGTGYDAMVDDPERVHVPPEATRQMEAWIDAAGEAPALRGAGTPRWIGRLGMGAIEEQPLAMPTGDGSLFGVLAQPTAGPTSPLCAVFLNAGAIRRVGPNRLWVTAARWAAAHGIPSLRLDLPGIGDADGDPYRLEKVESFYEPDRTPEVRLAIDHLAALGFGPCFAALGLCAGGYYAFRVAEEDRRVTDAILLNPGALAWDDGLINRLRASKLTRVLSGQAWGRLLHGEIQTAQVVHSVRALPRASARAVRGRLSAASGATPVTLALDRLRERDARVVLAFSGEEALESVLQAEGVLAGAGGRWPQLRLTTLPGLDHALRPAGAQRAALELMKNALGDASGR